VATIERVRVIWTGFTGAPGLSTFYGVSGLTLAPRIRTFFAAIATVVPSNVTWSIEPFGARIDDTNGNLVGDWSITPAPANVQGSAGTVYQAPTGLMINWITGSIVNGRFLRGKTFIVPGPTGSADGTPVATNLATIQAAASALITPADNLKVWHRPSAPGATDGSSALVNAAQVPDKFMVLRSRRD